MIFERAAVGALSVAVFAIVSVGGCAARTAPSEVAVELSAVHAIHVLPASQSMKLPLTVHLRNDGTQRIDLTAPTSCAVFRWFVVSMEKKPVQSKPNRLCAQAVAMATLAPARQLEQSHEISLDPKRYTVGHRYRLIYQFWGYSGHHDFVVGGVREGS